MAHWWNQPKPDELATGAKEHTYLVVSFALHDLPTWEQNALAHIEQIAATALTNALELVKSGLRITHDPDNSKKIATVDLKFAVDIERARRIQALLAQPKKTDPRTGEQYLYSNSYRFISCVKQEQGDVLFHATAQLAQGVWSERTLRDGTVKRAHALDIIPITTGLQQLISIYVAPDILSALPPKIRAGVAQMVAQDIASYLGLRESDRVRSVSLPLPDERDPNEREEEQSTCLEDLLYALDPPKKLAMPGLAPTPFPLLFTQGISVPILLGEFCFDSGVSKSNRHRGLLAPSEIVRAARPQGVRDRGHTGLSQFYAALPLGIDDLQRDPRDGKGRGLDLGLRKAPISGGKNWRGRKGDMLVPLSTNRDRGERILRSDYFSPAWSRLVRSGAQWFLQLTLRVPTTPANSKNRPVLGVYFESDGSVPWVLADEYGAMLESGVFSGAESANTLSRARQGFEHDRAKGRWLGRSKWSKARDTIAHRLANQIVRLAREKAAVLAMVDISHVKKSGPDAAENVVTTHFDYGRQRDFIRYHALVSGCGDPVLVSQYIVEFTCPNCGAIRRKGETQENAATWKEKEILHCRKCEFNRQVTLQERAARVALAGLNVWRGRWKNSQ